MARSDAGYGDAAGETMTPVDDLRRLLDEDEREALADIRCDHWWIGPSLSPDNYDDSGQCSCGRDECEVSLLLGWLDRLAAAESQRRALDVERLPFAICKGLGIDPRSTAAEPFFANAEYIRAALKEQSR